MIRARLGILLITLLAGCSQHPASPEEAADNPEADDSIVVPPGKYLIHLPRPVHIGDTFEMHRLQEMKMIMVMGPPSAPDHMDNQTKTTELTGRMEVTAINAKGQPASISITLRKFTGEDDKELLAPGSILDIITGPKDTAVKLRGGKLSEPAISALQKLFKTIDSQDMDMFFASRTPRSIGETWSFLDASGSAAKSAAKVNSDLGMQAEAKELRGEATLQKLETVNGTDSLRLDSILSANIKVPSPLPGLNVDRSTFEMHENLLLPVERSLGILERESDFQMHIAISGSILFKPVKMRTDLRQEFTLTQVAK